MGFIYGRCQRPAHLVLNPASIALEEGLFRPCNRFACSGFPDSRVPRYAAICQTTGTNTVAGRVSFHRNVALPRSSTPNARFPLGFRHGVSIRQALFALRVAISDFSASDRCLPLLPTARLE